MSVGRQQCTEYSGCLKEEAVIKSSVGSMDAPVSSSRWQDGEESIRVMGGVEYNAGGLVDAAVVVKGIEDG